MKAIKYIMYFFLSICWLATLAIVGQSGYNYIENKEYTKLQEEFEQTRLKSEQDAIQMRTYEME